ncbi:MAG: NUDIX hydrolase [Candidatus Magasanikbacteria bacterium]|jgi:ADP-ribose pyrophosphatase|nr:NUDIX hydrolase [Candidatus Magasanikbacteria bacterium]MBT4314952.1 NUDIX hydrolase [Candidatus Magasanikbacteria bacterium]MBT4546908.1 NUDIX hydrolase [Candidatus Magasanikbacteria bacterium]MBT6819178.1 NUDIX hydrolase [Candidatus Magasanikbacteria bacterium]
MPKHLKKISEETIHKNPWWIYKHDKYEKPNGEEGDYYYGETPGNAMVVPVLDDGRIVLVLQQRYLREKQSIEFPCGGIFEGQGVLDAAKRELLEETGYVADEYIKIGEFEGLNGLVKDMCHVFLAYVTEQEAQQLDDTEEIEVMYRRPDEIDTMIRKNEIWDGQTLAAWAMVHHNFLHKDSQS